MARKGCLVALAALVALGITAVNAQQTDELCGECDASQCPPIEDCPGAETMDSCNCCKVCQRSLGQRCDLNPAEGIVYGPCGRNMRCLRRVDIAFSTEATCECNHQEEVCGTDGITYPTSCHLLERAQLASNLTVQRQGPCPMAPKIKTPPMSSERDLGGILVLDCEAVGVPVPTITWELYKDNGVAVKLPNDDSGVAVQIRGGPESHMVTGWVQIMKISKDNVGTYVCKASNKEGEAIESAKITYRN